MLRTTVGKIGPKLQQVKQGGTALSNNGNHGARMIARVGVQDQIGSEIANAEATR